MYQPLYSNLFKFTHSFLSPAGSSKAFGSDDPPTNPSHKDNSFREFRRICAAVSDEPSYTGKTEIVSNFFKYGAEKGKWKKGGEWEWKIYCAMAVVKWRIVEWIYSTV